MKRKTTPLFTVYFLIIYNYSKMYIIWNIFLTLNFKTNVVGFIFSKNSNNSGK